MNWAEKQIVLRRLGLYNFDSEDEYDEFYKDLDTPQQRRISKAMCEAEEYGEPHFNWNRSYFKTNINNNDATTKSNQKKSKNKNVNIGSHGVW